MFYRSGVVTLCLAGLILLSLPARAATIAVCDSGFTVCDIPENLLLQLPFTAIAGDAVVTEPGTGMTSDIFHIFNNVMNTGGGTGLGNMAFLYSSDDSGWPDPFPISANAVFITEDPSGITPYLGNGTNYLLGTPEPQTFEPVSLAVVALAILARGRSRKLQGGHRCDRYS